jgi:hypothetical protein
MMNEREVLENIRSVAMPSLQSDELERIRLIYQHHDFYDNNAKQGR